MFQKILIATDFSASAEHAAQYAISQFSDTVTEVCFLSIVSLPSVDTLAIASHNSMLVEQTTQHLNDLVDRYSGQFSSTTFSSKLEVGGVDEEILGHLEKESYDLLVMGIRGLGKIEKFLVGSSAAYIPRKATVPTLIVPENAQSKSIGEIAFASGDVPSEQHTAQIASLCKSLTAQLTICRVEEETTADVTEAQSLDNLFEGTPHRFYDIYNDDVVDGLASYQEEFKVDLFILIPQEYHFFENIFHPSVTKQMIYHTHVPVLTLPTVD